MASVSHLPTSLNVDAAWREYTALVRQMHGEPALREDQEHCIATAKAWERWQRLFLASERAA